MALSAERDIDKLLELILRKSREITAADAGSLYLVERGEGAATGTATGSASSWPRTTRSRSPFEEFTIPLDETSIAGYVALTGEPVNVADAYHLPEGSPYTRQPLVRRAGRATAQVDAGRADEGPQGRS